MMQERPPTISFWTSKKNRVTILFIIKEVFMEYFDDNPDSASTPTGESRPDRNQVNRMAVASMLCGLTGALLLCGCVAFPLSILLGVAAISLAIYSRKGAPLSGYAIAGLILGSLALILGLLEGVYLIMVNRMLRDPAMASIFNQIMEQYEGTAPTQ